VVARELTKVFEEIWLGRLSEAAAHWSSVARKGEFTIVLAGASPASQTDNEAIEEVVRRAQGGERLSDAAKAVAATTRLSRSELYSLALGRISAAQD
jgi:16S rRNA (cytidine1402-2'-O)-methyltransferase